MLYLRIQLYNNCKIYAFIFWSFILIRKHMDLFPISTSHGNASDFLCIELCIHVRYSSSNHLNTLASTLPLSTDWTATPAPFHGLRFLASEKLAMENEAIQTDPKRQMRRSNQWKGNSIRWVQRVRSEKVGTLLVGCVVVERRTPELVTATQLEKVLVCGKCCMWKWCGCNGIIVIEQSLCGICLLVWLFGR